jgi:hypothetical protein
VQLVQGDAMVVLALMIVFTIMLLMPVARMSAARCHDDSFRMESGK